tara:strand:- start:66 stop:296 length:231 start_codon:yes stop_codon:yes gene_type:complete
MKVTKVRYFKTNRGVGYEATTNYGAIWNDGNGGGTYYEPKHNQDGSIPEKYRKYRELPEGELEKMIDIYEGIKESK